MFFTTSSNKRIGLRADSQPYGMTHFSRRVRLKTTPSGKSLAGISRFHTAPLSPSQFLCLRMVICNTFYADYGGWFDWDEGNEGYIAHHGVEPYEVE